MASEKEQALADALRDMVGCYVALVEVANERVGEEVYTDEVACREARALLEGYEDRRPPYTLLDYMAEFKADWFR